MAPLKHPNVVRLLGVVTNPATHQLQAAVFEFMLHGDLHNFLKLRAPIPSSMNGGIGSYEQQQPMIDKERITSDHQDFLNISTQVSIIGRMDVCTVFICYRSHVEWSICLE
jgi:hypothetical protein